MTRLLLLFIAGGCGSLARYGLGAYIQQRSGSDLPWGTIVVNLAGCLLFGFVWSLSEHRMLITAEARLIILTGFMGAFTTFSTFAFDSSRLIHERELLYAAGNILLQNGLGIAAVVGGMALAKLL